MSLVNAFGKIGLDSTLQKIASYLQQVAYWTSRNIPDNQGRTRVLIDGFSNPTTLTTVSTINTVQSVTSIATLTNQTQQSGYSTVYDQYAQMAVCANLVRAQIKVS